MVETFKSLRMSRANSACQIKNSMAQFEDRQIDHTSNLQLLRCYNLSYNHVIML